MIPANSNLPSGNSFLLTHPVAAGSPPRSISHRPGKNPLGGRASRRAAGSLPQLSTPPRSRPELQQHFLQRMGHRQQFQQLFEHLPGVYFYVKDSQHRIMGASRLILERFGLTDESQIIGTTDYDYFPRYVAEAFIRDDQRVMRTGQPLINYVEVWYTEQKLLDWFIKNKLPVRDPRGEVIGVMGTLRTYEGHRRSSQTLTQIDAVVEHIRHHHREKLSVTELADMADISARQLHRKFVEVFGMSVQEFLARARIRAACEALIHTDLPIASIASDFSYCDQSAFTQQFKQHMGVTPLRFRKNHQH